MMTTTTTCLESGDPAPWPPSHASVSSSRPSAPHRGRPSAYFPSNFSNMFFGICLDMSMALRPIPDQTTQYLHKKCFFYNQYTRPSAASLHRPSTARAALARSSNR